MLSRLGIKWGGGIAGQCPIVKHLLKGRLQASFSLMPLWGMPASMKISPSAEKPSFS